MRESPLTLEAAEFFILNFVDLTLLFHDLPIRKVVTLCLMFYGGGKSYYNAYLLSRLPE